MKRGTLFSLCWIQIFVVGCDPFDPGHSSEPVPMHVHRLSMEPGCYTAMSPGQSFADMNRSFMEMNLDFNLQYAGLYAQVILEDPLADTWSLVIEPGDGMTRDISIETVERSPGQSRFSVTMHSYGWMHNGTGGQEYRDVTGVGEGWADAAASHLEYPTSSFAWSDHAIEAWMTVGMQTRQPDGTVETVTTDFYVLRGCDPAREISFVRHSDGATQCWSNASGEAVSCSGVDFWP